jgi:hypothetical protein
MGQADQRSVAAPLRKMAYEPDAPANAKEAGETAPGRRIWRKNADKGQE